MVSVESPICLVLRLVTFSKVPALDRAGLIKDTQSLDCLPSSKIRVACEGIDSGLHAPPHAELSQDVADMVFHGFHAYAKSLRYGAIALPFDDEIQDIFLPPGKLRVLWRPWPLEVRCLRITLQRLK